MHEPPPVFPALDEPSRMASIEALGLRGHLEDPDLDAIVATVAEACRVPMAALSIITTGQQLFPSERGLGAACTRVPDHLSFCTLVVRTGQPLAVPDARLHPVFRDNPLVESGDLRAYAGAPLVYAGRVIGALSVFDRRPRGFTPTELQVLRSQAQVASSVLRLRAADREAGPEDREDVQARELGRALVEGQMVLHYQPVMDLLADRMVGVEALVRWEHPTRGLLAPLDFIPLAEASGLIVELGEWVLREAAAQVVRWARAGHHFDVAINVSPRQMSDPEFARRVKAVLVHAGAAPARIVLEVTESALMDQPHAAASLKELRDLGVRLALDDFGTGYSSFPYLRRFPIDIIKIDRSFVAGIGRNVDDEAIVASIVGLARNTGKTVIAEGVEKPMHADVLRALGATCGQGFLWAAPLPADELVNWAAQHEAAKRRRSPAGVWPEPAAADSDSSPHAVILGMHAAGCSLATIAAALNRQGRRTHTGLRWHASSVAQVVARAPHVAR